jgi:hypothetical protein
MSRWLAPSRTGASGCEIHGDDRRRMMPSSLSQLMECWGSDFGPKTKIRNISEMPTTKISQAKSDNHGQWLRTQFDTRRI